MSSPGSAAKTPAQPVAGTDLSLLLKRAFPIVMASAIWFSPVPAGLTPQSWHLFAIFATAIISVLLSLYTLLTSTMLAAGAVVLTNTISPEKAFAGFANSSVLLVVVAFLVAQAVVKCGLGHRIALFMVGLFGRSSTGLAYSIVLTDAAIAPAFPSNTARGGVLFPIVLSVAQGSGSHPDDPQGRRLGGYLMFCAMASLAVSSALWMTATSANPIAIQVAQKYGVTVDFGKWMIASSVPALICPSGSWLKQSKKQWATREIFCGTRQSPTALHANSWTAAVFSPWAGSRASNCSTASGTPTQAS